jgi:hypothetical protein
MKLRKLSIPAAQEKKQKFKHCKRLRKHYSQNEKQKKNMVEAITRQ